MSSVIDGPMDVHDPSYMAEKAALGCGTPFADLDEVVDYLSQILGTAWWRRRFPRVAWVEVATAPNRRRYAYNHGRTIVLPGWAMHEAYVLHELAHVVAPDEEDHHGAAWRGIYTWLVATCMGQPQADELLRWYSHFGLDVDPPPTSRPRAMRR